MPIIAKVMALPHLIAGGVLLLLMSPVLILVALLTGRFFQANVQAHPSLGAGASVDRGIEIGVIIQAGQQGGS